MKGKKITILSFASSAHSVEAYDRVVTCIKKRGYQVIHVGLSPRQWNVGDNLIIGKTYRKFKYHYFEIPRLNYGKTLPTKRNDYIFEIKESFPKIYDLVEKMAEKYSFDAILTDIDRYLPQLIRKMINNHKKIPLVLIEHGNGGGLDYLLIYKNLFRKKIIDIYRAFRYSLFDYCRKIIKHVDDLHFFLEFPRIKLFGENNPDKICCYSKFTFETYTRFGIPGKKLIATGYPYLDRIFEITEKIKKEKKNPRKPNTPPKILVIVSGINFASQKLRNDLYECILKIYESQGDKYRIYLRVKPGEERLPILSPPLSEKFKKIKIRYDDNLIPSYKAVQKYDLVVGEVGCTVMTEALLLQKPVVIFRYSSVPKNMLLGEFLFMKMLHAFIIDNSSDLDMIFVQALRNDYKKRIEANFNKFQEYFLYKFDGLAGERVADVVVKAVNNRL